MTSTETTIDGTLHRGTAEEVLALRDPIGGGPLRIEYCETAKGSHFRVTGTQSDFIMRMSGRLQKPTWIGVLGTDFVTTPPSADKAMHRMAAPRRGLVIRESRRGRHR
jgi:hypothetical protein